MPLVINVGPTQRFKELHEIPEPSAGTVVNIHWRPEPYRSKMTFVPRMKYNGVANPDTGAKPMISGIDAIEAPWAKYYSSYIISQGIFTAAAGANGQYMPGCWVNNLRMWGARRENRFKSAVTGTWLNWNFAATAVAMYRAKQVRITNSEIFGNENGVFGTTDSGGNVVEDVTISGNTFWDNGRAFDDHYHNSYIEAVRTLYEYNTYLTPTLNSGGNNVKDRSAAMVFRYNWVEGGARLLDMVDPEAGGPIFQPLPEWQLGDHVYGNVWWNKHSRTPFQFGYDGREEYQRWLLHFWYNTCVDFSWEPFVYWFKTKGNKIGLTDKPLIRAANNIFMNANRYGNPNAMLYQEYDGGTLLDLVTNGLIGNIQKASDEQPSTVNNWDDQYIPFVPAATKFDAFKKNVEELPPMFTIDQRPFRLGAIGWPVEGHIPAMQWDGVKWVNRTSLRSLGAVEVPTVRSIEVTPAESWHVAPVIHEDPLDEHLESVEKVEDAARVGEPISLTKAPVRPSKPLNFTNGPTIKGLEWMQWPWGVQNFEGDVLVTDHNGASQIIDTFGARWNIACGTHKPLVADFEGSGRKSLLFRSDSQKTAWLNEGGYKFRALDFQYSTGNMWITQSGNLDGSGVFSFGHDFGRWKWNGNGFTKINYAHPTPPSIAGFLDGMWKAVPAGKYLRVWYYDLPQHTICTGFMSYGGPRFTKVVKNSTGQDVTASSNLPGGGTVVGINDTNKDGTPDLFVIENDFNNIPLGGLYQSMSEWSWTRLNSPISEPLRKVGNYPHNVYPLQRPGTRLTDFVIHSPRERSAWVFWQRQPGMFELVKTFRPWDAEGIVVADFNGDGCPDIAVGEGDVNSGDVRVQIYLTNN